MQATSETQNEPSKKIDWALLRQQKLGLLSMANENKRPTSEIEVLDGVIALLDHIQDNAVEKGLATESEVFGPQWVIYSPSEFASKVCDDHAGFWNNEDGWTVLKGATRYSDGEKQAFEGLPGADGVWMDLESLPAEVLESSSTSQQKFFKTIIHYEVLSADEPFSGSLEELAQEVTDGEMSGRFLETDVMQLSREQVSAALLAQGSDPSFLLGEEGDDTVAEGLASEQEVFGVSSDTENTPPTAHDNPV